MTDPTETDARAKDGDAKRTLRDEAVELLEPHGVFMLAVRALRIRWFGALMDAKDWEVKEDLVRKLQVLDALPKELKLFITDYKFELNKRPNVRGN